MSKKMRISGVARGQYKQLCPASWSKCEGDESILSQKIRRAVKLGMDVHTYRNGCIIVRYHYLNFLLDNKEIMTVWKDKSRPPYHVSESEKRDYGQRSR